MSVAPPTGFTCPLAEQLAPDVLERFLRYVVIDTQADHASTSYPSRPEQLELSRLLADELRGFGLPDVELTEHGYVLATVPGRSTMRPSSVSSRMSTPVPRRRAPACVRSCTAGGPASRSSSPATRRRCSTRPSCRPWRIRVGHDIVTSDGTTLLGADDKAGVAEIMAAARILVADEQPRAPIRIAFTVDEETGRGTEHFDLDAFGADLAYTLDGSGLGELELETFSAYQLRLTIRGVAVHPGSAKGRLVNAVKLLADVVAALPRDTLSPETTEGREGFVHPARIAGGATEATLWMILRDHDDERLEEHVTRVRALAERIVGAEPRASFGIDVEEQYRNMRGVLDLHPEVVSMADEAIRRIGVEPVHTIIRGGTDGARLSQRGLPTPNLFTGGQDYHSVREWASVQDMAAAAATIVELVRLWGEREPPAAG